MRDVFGVIIGVHRFILLAFLEVFEDRDFLGDIDWHWFHEIFLHPREHDPEPANGDRPTYRWTRFIFSVCGLLYCLSTNNTEFYRCFTLVRDQARIQKNRIGTKSKHGCVTACRIYKSNRRSWPHDSGCQQILPFLHLNITGIYKSPIHTAPILLKHRDESILDILVLIKNVKACTTYIQESGRWQAFSLPKPIESFVVTPAISAVANKSQWR